MNKEATERIPGIAVDLDGVAYFAGEDGPSGRELWRSDGTSAGTRRVADVLAGEESSSPSLLTPVGASKLFFVGSNFGTRMLCVTDGTEANTRVVFTVSNGISEMIALPDQTGVMFVVARGSASDIWVSDGTEAGTRLLWQSALSSGETAGFAKYDGKIYFRARDIATGSELWRTDGTASGTELYFDAVAGSVSSGPQFLTAYNGRLYFVTSTQSPLLSQRLWVTNGTAADPTLLLNVSPISGSSIWGLTGMGSNLYFGARTVAQGAELWQTDGTPTGTQIVLEIAPSSQSSTPSHLLALNDTTLLFQATDAAGGRELWCTDGTSQNTQRVIDLYPGTGSAFGPASFVQGQTDALVIDGVAYFVARKPANGFELFRTDGTAAGTSLVYDVFPGVTNGAIGSLSRVGNRIHFVGRSSTANAQPWVSDGTTAGTAMLSRIWQGTADANPVAIGALSDDRLLFAAEDGVATDPGNTRDLFVTDGTSAGTIKLANVFGAGVADSLIDAGNGNYFFVVRASPSPYDTLYRFNASTGTVQAVAAFQGFPTDPLPWSQLDMLTPSAVAGTLFFRAKRSNGTGMVWKSDGTPAGTVALGDFAEVSDGQTFVRLGNKHYFTANDGVSGREIWSTNGTVAGTTQLIDLNPGATSSSPHSLTVVGDLLYFSANNTEVFRQDLWVTDGTAPGTRYAFADYAGDAPVPVATELFPDGERLFFITSLSNSESILWHIDESGTPPQRVWHFNGNGGFGFPFVWDGNLFFTSFDETSDRVLWRSDATPAGTGPFKVLDGYVAHRQVIGRSLYFTTKSISADETLWISDGTAHGTSVLKHLEQEYPSAYQLEVDSFTHHNGVLLFRVGHQISSSSGMSYSIWQSLGTADETVRVAMPPGPDWIMTSTFSPTAANVYFAAFDRVFGKELRVISDDRRPTSRAISLELERSPIAIQIQFSEPISASSLSVDDLMILSKGGGPAIQIGSITYDASTFSATYHIANIPADGLYTATLLPASVADHAGNTSISGTSLDFHILAGDTNRDRRVDFSDLLILAQNYGQTGRTFSQGNIDYSADGLVSFEDLLILAQRYGTSLATNVPSMSGSKRRRGTGDILV